MTVSVRCDVLVIGVGGMGAAALAHLAKRGVDVIGVEQDDVPSLRGSSVGETRVIRKAYLEGPEYVPLLERAYALWAELEAFAGETLYVRTGCMTMGPRDHKSIRGVLESARRYALPYRELGEDEIRASFPALAPSPGDRGVLEEDAGYLHVERCTRAHAAWATSMGATLRTKTRIASIRFDGGVHATLDDGTTITAKKAVLSAGAWLPAFAPTLPLVIERQVQLWFSPAKTALPAFIHYAGGRTHYAIPTAESLKVCRHHGGEPTAPDALDRELRERDVSDVREYMRAHLPSCDAAPVRSRVCMYTNTPDEHFLVGRAPWNDDVVLLGGFSGHGYKMASVMGEIAADLVTEGETRFDLRIFDPRRFG
jgi:sarcosine oxidase